MVPNQIFPSVVQKTLYQEYEISAKVFFIKLKVRKSGSSSESATT